MSAARKKGMLGVRGQAHPRSKLTDEQRKQLIEDRNAGVSLVECAAKYKLSPEQVSRIHHGHSGPG